MNEAIKNFPRQFAYVPEIINDDRLVRKDIFIVLGMGGSHLAADLIASYKPTSDIIIHSDYGLDFPESVLQNALIIASSYSGNTEEVLDGFKVALDKKLPVAAVAVGGRLIEGAQKNQVPYVQLPNTGIQPRSAIGLSLRAILKIMGDDKTLAETDMLATSLKPNDFKTEGRALAGRLKGYIPVIYTSPRKYSVGYNWKIKFNENTKIPAFTNVIPELNHNEMTGFDAVNSTRELSKNFYFLFIKDRYDHPQIVRRMDITEKLYRDREFKTESINLSGENHFHKIFSSLLLADWTSYFLGKEYGVEIEQVPMVEEFKKLIA